MTTFTVKGMSCGHCVKSITNVIKALDPAASVAVDLAHGRVEIESTEPDKKLAAAINSLDFFVIPA
jgi:copper chaperone